MKRIWPILGFCLLYSSVLCAQDASPTRSDAISALTLSEEERDAQEEAQAKEEAQRLRAHRASQFRIPVFETYVAATVNPRIEGAMNSFLADAYPKNLYDNPIQFTSLIAGIRLFPLENLGFETSATFGELSARTNSQKFDNRLLNSLVLKLGLNGKLFLLKTQSVGLSVSISGGVNYSIVTMTGALKNQIASTKPAGYHVDGIDNSFGFYAKPGVQAYFLGLLYVGFFNEISYQANRRVNSGENLDGFYDTLLGFEVGVYLH